MHISKWTIANHLKLSLNKTELLFMPGKYCPQMDLLVTFEDPFTDCKEHWYGTGRSAVLQRQHHLSGPTLYNCSLQHPQDPALHLCCFTRKAAQILVQALIITHLNHCDSLLAGLPASAIKPLQRIQNAAAHLAFNLLELSHGTPLFRDLHWLLVISHSRSRHWYFPTLLSAELHLQP